LLSHDTPSTELYTLSLHDALPISVDLHCLGVEGGDLGLDLALGAEHVAVVLGEAAHPEDAVQRAGRLVAVAAAEFAVADRQVARSEEHTSELQSRENLVCRLLLEK